MRRTANALIFTLVIGALVVSPMLVTPANAGVRVSFAYTSSPADIQVWLDRQGHDGEYYDDDDDYGEHDGYDEYDVYPSANDIVLYFRASRSCYATVYVVDTGGYIHVVHPYSIGDRAFVRGGRVYKIHLGEFGFYADAFDRGVAYAFAVSSPIPFDYSYYGAGVFGRGLGFQIWGDPYVASKSFYLSLIAGGCDRGLIGIGHARFYMREYVRYPRYLYVGWNDYYGGRGNSAVCRYYNLHARAPHQVLHPKYKLKHRVSQYTRIARHGERERHEHEARYKTRKHTRRKEFRSGKDTRRKSHYEARKHDVKKRSRSAARDDYKARQVHKKVGKSRTDGSRKIVRSSKKSFVKGKSRISAMRRQLKDRERSAAKLDKKKKGMKSGKRVQKVVKKGGKKSVRVKGESKAKKSSRAKKVSAAKSRSGGGKASKRGKR
ncbi:MAG: hypothetical protein ACE5EO_09095 [Candidatus Krumholzibacteriia bacterium]